MPMTTTEKLARFALDIRLSDLPGAVVENARLRLLDTLGVMLAGSRSRPAIIAREALLGEEHGPGWAAVIGTAVRAHPVRAAFLNGVSAHALEFDDITSSAFTHTSATAVPATMAVAQSRRASGRQFLEAYIASFEVTTRIGWGFLGNLLTAGWHPNGVLAVVGCAAGLSRLLGSSLAKTCAAMGIAASCSSGLRKNVGSMTKPFHMGHAAGDAVTAAELANRGFTADMGILDRGDLEYSDSSAPGHALFSFPDAFVGSGKYDLDRMVANLGEDWELARGSTITRFHPGSTFPQAAIDETLRLVIEDDLKAEAIERIDVGVTPTCLSIAPCPRPTDGMAARFSVPYSIAVAVLDRQAAIEQYEDERVQRSDVQAFMDRIRVFVPDELAQITGGWTEAKLTPVSARITIHTRDGREVTGSRDTTKGFPGMLPSWDDVAEKFTECTTGILSPAATRRCVQLLKAVETLDDVTELVDAASQGRS
jgi:2-methylcitrate dehydratase PrpD